MRFVLAVILIAANRLLAADGQAPASRPAGVDATAWNRMLEIDARAARIEDLTADFQQEKFTALLKKPLVSRGTVLVRGSAMLWRTEKPEPNILAITDREARIFYPAQKTIEVYQIQEKLGSLAASPLPRLAVLQQYFTFAPIAASDLGEADDKRFYAVRMTPIDDELRKHIEQVRVLLDGDRGLIVRLEMVDTDGDRTIITFTNVRPNRGLKGADLEIAAPADAKVTRPLAGLEGSSSASSPASPESDHK